MDPDRPEADSEEQHQPVEAEEDTPRHPHLGDEVPEADAIEQAVAEPWDDDDRR
ncbi:MAG TPA: hypothetical protein VE152_01655 [Acidimicrobiales bacterium]|nr:hypothetical protein [Acidimicrobiales bacterium]